MIETENSSKRRLVKAVRWSARVIGLIAIAFFLMMLIGEVVNTVTTEGFQGIDVGGFLVGAPIVIALAGFILSWWLEIVGGSLLILCYLLAGLRPAIMSLYVGRGFALGEAFGRSSSWWIITLPFLIAGLLFIISWSLSRETKPSA
jgi:hypothetical protein